MNTNGFRKELVKIMPGYKWTVRRPGNVYVDDTIHVMSAEGIQVAGFNRMSTLKVLRREEDGKVEYKAKSSGFGKKTRWLSENSDGTLARALRGLQEHYEVRAREYSAHAGALQQGRTKPEQD